MFRKNLILLALALSLPLAGCSDGTGAMSPGQISLMLTDAEGDVTQAWVTIERVELIGDGQAEVLLDEPFTTNLVELSNDIASLTEDVTVPGGSYSQLRFIIPEACIGVEQADQSERIYASAGFTECGEADGTLKLPSFGQSGLKVNLPGGSVQVDGDTHIILLDFDVSQSFGHEAGMSGSWVMHPVINAEDISLSGILTVELTAADGADLEAAGFALGDFEATVGDEDPVAFTDADEDGVYTATFIYLMPGDYDVSVALQEGVTGSFTLDPTSPQTVTVGSGGGETIAFEVTPTS